MNEFLTICFIQSTALLIYFVLTVIPVSGPSSQKWPPYCTSLIQKKKSAKF